MPSSPQLKFSIDPQALLKSIPGRQKCFTCGRSVKYVCNHCCSIALNEDQQKFIPCVDNLPFKLHIVRQDSEKASKSSAVPLAALVSPECVSLYSFPKLPTQLGSKAVLLFPSDDAVDSKTFNWHGVTDLVCVDCTWLQTKIIVNSMEFNTLPRVVVNGRNTAFWRYQFIDDSCLSSAEAIYFACLDAFHVLDRNKEKLDDLLFFFVMQRQAVLSNGRGGYAAVTHAASRRRRAQQLNQQRKSRKTAPQS